MPPTLADAAVVMSPDVPSSPAPTSFAPTSLATDSSDAVPIAPRSAAAEVFALPELLETILLCVSAIAEDAALVDNRASFRKYRVLFQGPTKEPFVLQRVNSSFQATISRNKTMQQRMFLETKPALDKNNISDVSGLDPTRSSFQWLVDEVGVVVEEDVQLKVQLKGNPENMGLGVCDYGGPSISTSKHASWRKMKFRCVEGWGSIDLNLSYDASDSVIPVRGFAEEEHMTLGKLYNGLQKLVVQLNTFVVTNSARDRSQRATESALESLKRLCVSEDLWE